MKDLQEKYPVEYKLYGLSSVAVAITFPLITKYLDVRKGGGSRGEKEGEGREGGERGGRREGGVERKRGEGCCGCVLER